MSCKPCEKIKEMQQNISNIAEGNFRRIVKSKETEALADKRRPICEGCPEKRKLIKVNQVQRYYCNACPSSIKCPVESKIRAKEETCPLNKW